MEVSTFIMSVSGVLVMILILGMIRKRKQRRGEVNYKLVESSIPSEPQPQNIYLFTGGNGFLGSYLVKKLHSQKQQEGKRIKLYIFDITIPKEKLPYVNYITGDLTNPKHIERAIIESGCDTIFHMASLKPGVGVPFSLMYNINVNGTKNIVNVITTHPSSKVTRVIYTSSATVLIGKNDKVLLDIDESHPYPALPLDSYTQTKAEAERIILSLSENKEGKKNRSSFSIISCSIRPTGFFGPGDLVLCDPLLRNQNNVYIGEGKGLIDWVDIDSVVMAHIGAENALQENSLLVGQTYLISHTDRIEYRRFVGYQTTGPAEEEQLSHWGNPPPKSIPLKLCIILAYINEYYVKILEPLIGKVAPPLGTTLTVMGINFTQKSYTFSTKKAYDHFGYQPSCVSISDTIKIMAREHHTLYSMIVN